MKVIIERPLKDVDAMIQIMNVVELASTATSIEDLMQKITTTHFDLHRLLIGRGGDHVWVHNKGLGSRRVLLITEN